MVLGSPRRIRDTVLVTPGSSRNWAVRVELVWFGVWPLARDFLMRSKFLLAMLLNLSRARTLE